jgi:integrase
MTDKTETEEQAQPAKRKRAARRYWVEIKGNLYARLQYRDDDGKRRVKYKKITDKRTAQKIVSEMRKELEDHGAETLQSDKMTFIELAEKYQKLKLVPAVYSNGVKVSGKRSVAASKSALKPLIEYFAHKHLRSIKATDLENYKQKRLKTQVEIEINVKSKATNPETGKERNVVTKGKKIRPRSIATINRELALLRNMFNFAVQNDWLIKNPFVKVEAGFISSSAETQRERILSIEEELKLLAACTGHRAHVKALLICALDTALRRGEMFKMRWRDVNLETGEIFIPQTNTKTDAARSVGITPRLKTELEKLWEQSPKQSDGLVFGINTTIKTAWAKACKLSRINNFRLHGARHTATTRMIAAGVSHVEAMKVTGHTQLKTFLRYLNITPETARVCASKLSAYLTEKQDVLHRDGSKIDQ